MDAQERPTERDQLLGLAGVTLDPQKAVLEQTAPGQMPPLDM